MRDYVIRRLLLVVVTLWLVSLIVFMMLQMIPGDIVDSMIAELERRGRAGVDRETLVRMLGLDVPVYVQYGRWIRDIVLHGNLGVALSHGLPVTEQIFSRVGVTLELGVLAIIIAVAISLPIGILSAIRQDTFGDYSRSQRRHNFHRRAQLLGRHADFSLSLPHLELVAQRRPGPFHREPDRQPESVRDPVLYPRHGHGRHRHEDDPNDDARSAQAGLYQDSLLQRSAGADRRRQARTQKCADTRRDGAGRRASRSRRRFRYHRGRYSPSPAWEPF